MPVIIDIDSAPTQDLPHGRGKSAMLFNPSNGASHVDVHVNTLNPGVKAGTIHYHKTIENVYVIIEGEGKIIDVKGKEYPVRAGQAVFMKPGENLDTHEIYNTGSGPLKLVEIYAPAHPEEVYKDRKMNYSKRDHHNVKDTS